MTAPRSPRAAPDRCTARCTIYDGDEPRESWICNAPLTDGRCSTHGALTSEVLQQADDAARAPAPETAPRPEDEVEVERVADALARAAADPGQRIELVPGISVEAIPAPAPAASPETPRDELIDALIEAVRWDEAIDRGPTPERTIAARSALLSALRSPPPSRAEPPSAPTRPEDEPVDLDTIGPTPAEVIPLAPPAPTRDGTTLTEERIAVIEFFMDSSPHAIGISIRADEMRSLLSELRRLRALQSEAPGSTARAAALEEAARHYDAVEGSDPIRPRHVAAFLRRLAGAPPRAETGREDER